MKSSMTRFHLDQLENVEFQLSIEQLDPLLRTIAEEGAPEGERSDKFFFVVNQLLEIGWDQSRILSYLSSFPGGIAEKYEGRLDAEISRIVSKSETKGKTVGDFQREIEKINTEHFVLSEGGNVFVCRESFNHELGYSQLQRYTFDNFKKLYQNRKVQVHRSDGKTSLRNLASEWLENPGRREYPNGAALDPTNSLPKGVYNLWNGFSIVANACDFPHLKEFLFQTICSGDIQNYNYLIGWLASLVQYPQNVGSVAVVLRGGRGVGKSTFFDFISTILGRHTARLSHPDHLFGKFSEHLRSTVLVCVDEFSAKFARDNDGILKSLITEKSRMTEIKGGSIYSIRNHVHLMLASNDDFVVPAAVDERRYFITDVSDHKKQDHSYFSWLRDCVFDHELSGLLYFLLHYDLSDFNAFKVPQTHALIEQKISSLRTSHQWLFECLREGQMGGIQWLHNLIIPVPEGFSDYTQFAATKRNEGPVDRRALGRELKKSLGGCIRSKKASSSGEDGLRQMNWHFGSLEDCRRQFEKWSSMDSSIWDGEEDIADIDWEVSLESIVQ